MSAVATVPPDICYAEPSGCRQYVPHIDFRSVATSPWLTSHPVLLILRTYALYNCSKRMLALLISMHLGGAVHCLVRPSARRALHRELTRRLKSAVLTSKSPLTTDTPLGFRYSLCNLSLTDDQ